MPDLVTIRSSRGGVPFTVAREAAPKFQSLVDDLEKNGYPLRAKDSGGYNDRNIAGTSTKSQHAFGHAVDVNWDDNNAKNGKPIAIPPFLADSLARKNGMTWGGNWSPKYNDPMHFEVNPHPSETAMDITPAQVAPAGAYAAASPPVQTPSVPAPTAAPAASGAFTPPVGAPAQPASGGAFASMSNALSGAGKMMGQGDGGDDQTLAKIQDSNMKANSQALSEEDAKQAQALKQMLSRHTRSAFA